MGKYDWNCTLVSPYLITEENYELDFLSDSDNSERKGFFEVETPPYNAICPPLQYFKPIKAVGFV